VQGDEERTLRSGSLAQMGRGWACSPRRNFVERPSLGWERAWVRGMRTQGFGAQGFALQWRRGGGWGPVASPVFKTAWAAVRSPEGSTPFLLRLVLLGVDGCTERRATRPTKIGLLTLRHVPSRTLAPANEFAATGARSRPSAAAPACARRLRAPVAAVSTAGQRVTFGCVTWRRRKGERRSQGDREICAPRTDSRR
jgi:hypothetical protein